MIRVSSAMVVPVDRSDPDRVIPAWRRGVCVCFGPDVRSVQLEQVFDALSPPEVAAPSVPEDDTPLPC